MKVLTFLATLAIAAAVPLAAQQPDTSHRGMMQGMGQMHGQMGPGATMQGHMMMEGMDSMMAPMMRVMASTPEHLLTEKTTLHLTAIQVTRLTALADVSKTAHDAAARQAAMHMREFAQVMDAAAPDTSAARPHFEAAHRYMGDAMWAMVTAAAQARALLTDAQRKQVDEMAARPMRGGMMMQH